MKTVKTATKKGDSTCLLGASVQCARCAREGKDKKSYATQLLVGDNVKSEASDGTDLSDPVLEDCLYMTMTYI